MNALQEQVAIKTIESAQPENLETKEECKENNCRYAKLLDESNAAIEILQQKYNTMKMKYIKAMDLNLKLQEKMSTISTSEYGKTNQSAPVRTKSEKILCVILNIILLCFHF